MDPAALVEEKLWYLLLASDTVGVGCKIGNRLDHRRADADLRAKIHGAPNDFLEIEIAQTNGKQRTTTTPNFGLVNGEQCDAIIPITLIFEITIKYDQAIWKKKFPDAMSPEAEVSKAINGGFPKLGLAWVRTFEIVDRIVGPPSVGERRTTVARQVTIEGRVHQSQLR